MAFEQATPPGLLAYDAPTDGADEYAYLAGLLRPQLEAGDLVLAILDERCAEPLHERLLAVRSALETTRLVVHVTSLPPLAAAALVRTLTELDADGVVPPGVLASGMARLERAVVSAAWLGSVAKLRHPSPSLGMHARSWFKSTGFAAVLDDAPRVVRHKGPDAVIPLPELDPSVDHRVFVGTGLAELDPVEATLAQLEGTEIVHVPSRRSSVAWWGTENLVELAILPRSPDALGRIVIGAAEGRDETVRCDWCGEIVAAAICPLCGAATSAPLAVSGGTA
ncbi:MAG TPA: hypothetical protein VK906_06555 [Egicoccus sp.]|nr:hypothetical protein [Egicoccus sp.]HSK22816.1 hypothetical protein [Egicoccus sp.]